MIKDQNHSQTDYQNVLGFLGLVILQAGGRVEISYEDVLAFDASKYEVLSEFNQRTNTFVFQLRPVSQ